MRAVRGAGITDEHSAAVALLFGTEPTDRALAGRCPRVWIALGGDMVMPAKEWAAALKHVPSKYGIEWRRQWRAPGY